MKAEEAVNHLADAVCRDLDSLSSSWWKGLETVTVEQVISEVKRVIRVAQAQSLRRVKLAELERAGQKKPRSSRGQSGGEPVRGESSIAYTYNG